MRTAFFILVTSGLIWTGRAMSADTKTYDTGLAQQLRQQLSSDCYGFVDHDPEQIRGYEVNGAFQLLRDGYPWARFEDSANFLTQREEALVGGPGLGCAYTAPGGIINLVSRRGRESLRRAVAEFDQYGTANTRIEAPWHMGERLAGRLAGGFERFRDAAENEDRTGDLAVNVDLDLTRDTRLRLDAEWRRADWSSGVGWPAFEDLPTRIERSTSLTQPWARYRFDSLATLVALEHASSPETLWRAGITRVRYRADWHDLYLEPEDGNAFTLVDYVYPDQDYRFDAWHADVTRRGRIGQVAHSLRAGFSRLRAEEPDQVRPGQTVGSWRQGAVLPPVDPLPASAARELISEETRLSLSDTVRWGPWFGTLGLQYALFEDDNGSASLETARWLPVLSVGRSLTDQLSLVATRSWGAYGRQFASLTSENPALIQPATVSTETEIGIRWRGDQIRAGLALFEISRPYRFERQVVSVWRGEQRHRGIEATLQWHSDKTGTRVAATTQLLDASVTGTGEAALDGKQPPGVPSARALLYVEQRLGAESPWTLSVSGEGVSRRATFDDNAVFAPGYLRWDVGLQWTHHFNSVQGTVLLTIQNITDAFAWSDVGGGLAYPMPPRTFGITLSLEQ